MSHQPSSIFTIPLFPLHSTLFPLSPLQLHIFEERYKTMIAECIANDQPFGVVLIRQGRDSGGGAVPYEIGCTARILAVDPLEEGRMNLLAIGENRFRLLDYIEGEKPYLIGTVELMDDETLPSERVQKPVIEVTHLTQRYLQLLSECAGLEIPELELPAEASSLGFYVASIAQMPAMQKQTLLATTDPLYRLEVERTFLLQQIEELESLQQSSESASDQNTVAGEGETQVKVLYAESLNLQSEFWQKHGRQSRN